MRNVDSPYLVDLAAVFMRWLVLLGLALSLGIAGKLTPGEGTINLAVIGVLALLALCNSFFSMLAMFNRRIVFHRPTNLALDILFAIWLFLATGGPGSPVSWVSFLPIASGALYFGVPGALAALLIVSLGQIGFIYQSAPQSFFSQPTWLVVGFNLIVGLLVGLISPPLIHSMHRFYVETASQRREGELKVQRQERDRMKTLFEMIETFSGTLNYQKVLEYALDTAINAVGDWQGVTEESMVGAVLLFDEQRDLEVKAARGLLAQDASVRIPAETGIINDVLKSGGLMLLQEPGQDPELSMLATLHEHAAAVCLPLIRGLTAYGVMLFAHRDGRFFSPERVEILQMLSNQAVISLQNARLYQDLSKEKERILQTQEEAQKSLSRALHDGPTQSVAAIAMRVAIARKMLEKSPQDASEELARVEELARRTTQEIRHMLFTMRPLVLESEGLSAALQAMADKMHDLYQQNVVIETNEEAIQQLDSSRQSVIFALVEEAVNNARKHAQASEVLVKLQYLPQDCNILLLEIIDNGSGFDVKSIMSTYDRRGSLGMVIMQERTDLINGQMKIDSALGKGTRVRFWIPVNEAAAVQLHDRR